MIKRNDGNTYRGSFAHLRWDLGDNAILWRDTGDRTGLEMYIHISFFVRQNQIFRLASPHSLHRIHLHSCIPSFIHYWLVSGPSMNISSLHSLSPLLARFVTWTGNCDIHASSGSSWVVCGDEASTKSAAQWQNTHAKACIV